jgi:hypothetical protein
MHHKVDCLLPEKHSTTTLKVGVILKQTTRLRPVRVLSIEKPDPFVERSAP